MNSDILIIGGGVIGSAAAYFLNKYDTSASIIVVEPDPLYEFAATPRASGGIRRLFSLPENIGMSQWSLDFYLNFTSHVEVNGNAPSIGFKQQGYLFVVPPHGIDELERSHAVQRSHGVNVELLDCKALAKLFPSLQLDDIGAAAYSPEDGCIDPNAALQGFKQRARHGGVIYEKDRVVAMAKNKNRVSAVTLASGRTLHPEIVINAAGTWSAEICAMIDLALPVEPMQRLDHFFESATQIEPLPFIKDVSGLGFHPEGRGYTGSVVNHTAAAGHNFNVDHAYFETVVWPHLAALIPAFEALKVRSSWAGHYDRNRLDGNMILGNWPTAATNFYMASGFSGHGLMHAPAVGRALSELILKGAFQSLDLSRMGYSRVALNTPYAEAGIR